MSDMHGQAASLKVKREMKVISGGNQMSLIRDTEEILKFLEFTANKNILDEHAVQCRLTACHNLFSVVTEDEDSVEYMLNNLEVFVNRFKNKNKITNEATLRVYKSRTKSSLEDYKSWSADPFAWERSLLQKQKVQTEEKRAKKAKKAPKVQEPAVAEVANSAPVALPPVAQEVPAPLPQEAAPAPAPLRIDATRFSFPLRPGLNIELKLPEDGITWKEYQRIGLFLYAYCKDVDFDGIGWGNKSPQ